MINISTGERLESILLIDGKLEVIKRTPSNSIMGDHTAFPDRVTKEIFAAVNGEIKLVETKEGTHSPAKFIEESVTFKDN